jgi:FMN-dependent NADH-azoreductase
VAARLLDELGDAHPEATLTVRDLARDPLPHIDQSFLDGLSLSEEQRGPAERTAIERSDDLIDELLAADTVVIAAPMYNFSIPSTLKAWIDHIARAGRTFQVGDDGAQGLVRGKRVILVLARGGVYSSGPMRQLDYQSTYLRSILSFLGMTDVRIIEVEGTESGLESALQAVEAASRRARELVAVPATA